MTAIKDNIKKKLFIKLYSESDARLLIPGSERASELVHNLQRDNVKKIYIIASNESISWPYKNIFQNQIPGIVIRDLVLEKIERQDIYAIKSIIDDINASIKMDLGCEIVLFNGSLAGIILACFYIKTGKSAALSIEQVKMTIPNVLLSGSDISFINEFHDFVRGARTVKPEHRPEPERRPVEMVEVPLAAEAKIQKQESGAVKDMDAIRCIVDQAEPAGVLLRFRIATKLIAFVALILVISMSLIIFLGTAFFKRDSQSKINNSNATVAQLVGDRLQDEIASSLQKARVAAEFSSIGRSSDELVARVKEMLFSDKNNFIFMGIAGKEGDELKFKKSFYNEDYINETRISRDTIRGLLIKNAGHFKKSFNRKIIVRNVSPDAGIPLLGISFPYKHKGGSVASVIVCYVPLERFMDAVRVTGPARTFMVNDRGDCVVDAEQNRVLSRVNMADVPIVKKMLLSTANNGSMRYRDRDGLYHLGSYKKLDMFGLGVIVTAAEDSVLRGVYNTQRRNFIVLAIILIAAVLGAFIFSKTISAPIEALKQIAVAAPPEFLKLSAPGKGDEIFYLTQSFREVLRSYLDLRERPDYSRRAEEPAAGGTAGEAGAAVPERKRDAVTQQFGTEGLKIQVTYDGPEVYMVWMGKGNLVNPGELLNPYLEGIINSMRGRNLTCDFSSLETMNASIIQSIIKFANIVDENRVRARFVYNKSIDWQDASFEALSAVVREMDTISFDGRLLEKNMFILP
jgi:hypothetical protein